MKLHELSIDEAGKLLKNKEITSRELTEAVLSRISSVDEKVGAYITVDEERALSQAEAADERLKAGEGTPLTGIPLSIKDLIVTRGLTTTSGSQILKGFVPPYDAGVMERLGDDFAVTAGKVNMDEFGMGSTTENSGYMITKNPWDLTRVPGGSSGGSAASVAAGMCLGSLGSDTGGSIRQPASHCGVVGLKPTYGRVSRYGLIAFASSLDQIGPITRTVKDSALILSSIAGHDGRDSTSANRPVDNYMPEFDSSSSKPLSGLTIGLPVEYNETGGLDPDVAAAVSAASRHFESLGAKCIEISLPHTRFAVAAYYVIAPSEASANLARFDGVRYGFREEESQALIDMYKNTKAKGFGEEVKRRIIIGTYALSSGYYDAYYKKASQVRTLISEDFSRAFESCDLILSPTAPSPAQKIGASAGDPLSMYLSDIFTLSANLAGIPGISVPCGYSADGLPIGLQLLAPHFEERSLIRAAYCYEQTAGVNGRKPAL